MTTEGQDEGAGAMGLLCSLLVVVVTQTYPHEESPRTQLQKEVNGRAMKEKDRRASGSHSLCLQPAQAEALPVASSEDQKRAPRPGRRRAG